MSSKDPAGTRLPKIDLWNLPVHRINSLNTYTTMLQFFLKSTFIVLLTVAGFNLPCRAQYSIPLDSVAKITFASSAPWWNGPRYHKVEVVQEDGIWKAYQLQLHINDGAKKIEDVNRKFLRSVAKKDLTDLLKLINISDTVIHPDLFHIDKKRVLSEFDTLLPLLKPKQKTEIANLVNKKKVLDSMIVNEMRRSVAEQSDLSGYYITINTKANKTVNVTASANEYTFGHLPWRIGSLISFDPRISNIFDKIIAAGYPGDPLDRFYGDMVFWTYMKYFRTKLNVENLREDFPIAYKSLTETFKILSIVSSNRIHSKTPRPIDSLYYWGGFKTPLLPKYVNLSFNFKPADTATITSRKRYVDTLMTYFKTSNFLFDYLKSNGEGSITFSPTQNEEYGEQIFNSAKKLFPDIADYNYKEIQIVHVVGKPGLASRWLLLPDNTLLLCRYSVNANGDFMNIAGYVLQKHAKELTAVCIHFDSAGKLIKDYTRANGVFFGY